MFRIRIHTHISSLIALVFVLAFLSAPPAAHAANPMSDAVIAAQQPPPGQAAPTPPPVDWPGLVLWLGSEAAVAYALAVLVRYIPGLTTNPGGQIAAALALSAVFAVLKYIFTAFTPEQATTAQALWEIIRRILNLFVEVQLITVGARGVKVATLALLGGRSHALALMQAESPNRVKAVG